MICRSFFTAKEIEFREQEIKRHGARGRRKKEGGDEGMEEGKREEKRIEEGRKKGGRRKKGKKGVGRKEEKGGGEMHRSTGHPALGCSSTNACQQKGQGSVVKVIEVQLSGGKSKDRKR